MNKSRIAVAEASDLHITLDADAQYGSTLPTSVKDGIEHAMLDYRFAQRNGDKYSGWIFRPGCVTVELANKYLGEGSVSEKDLKNFDEKVHDYFYNVGRNFAELYKSKGVPSKWKDSVRYTTYDIDIESDNVVTTYEFEFKDVPESMLVDLFSDMSSNLDRLENNGTEMKKMYVNVTDKLPARSAESSARRLGNRFAQAAKKPGKPFQEQVEDIAKAEGWSVSFGEGAGNSKYVEFGQGSPAGEDFYFSVYPKNETLESLHDEIYHYVMSYDAEEEASIWLDEDGNGINGAPDREALIEDKEAILEMVKSLEQAVLKASRPGRKLTSSARSARAEYAGDSRYDNATLKALETAYTSKGFMRLESECTPSKVVVYQNTSGYTAPNEGFTFSAVAEITLETVTHKLFAHSAAGSLNDPIASMTHKTISNMGGAAKNLAQALSKAADAVSYL